MKMSFLKKISITFLTLYFGVLISYIMALLFSLRETKIEANKISNIPGVNVLGLKVDGNSKEMHEFVRLLETEIYLNIYQRSILIYELLKQLIIYEKMLKDSQSNDTNKTDDLEKDWYRPEKEFYFIYLDYFYRINLSLNNIYAIIRKGGSHFHKFCQEAIGSEISFEGVTDNNGICNIASKFMIKVFLLQNFEVKYFKDSSTLSLTPVRDMIEQVKKNGECKRDDDTEVHKKAFKKLPGSEFVRNKSRIITQARSEISQNPKNTLIIKDEDGNSTDIPLHIYHDYVFHYIHSATPFYNLLEAL